MNLSTKTLYLFVDESGNFDFSLGGTKYFIMTSLSTTDPYAIASPLLHLRYNLLPNYAGGKSFEDNGYFHAAEDAQVVRDAVFSTIMKNGKNMRIDSVIAQKNKANPVFYSQHLDLYKKMGEVLLKYILVRANWGSYNHIVLVFSSLFDRKKEAF